MMTHFEFVRVPPPLGPIEDADAAALGLVRGLRAEREGSGCRCNHCNAWISAGGWLVWVPDSVRITDSAAEVEEQCRVNAYNGSASGWCLQCASRLSTTPPRSAEGKGHRSIFVKAREWFAGFVAGEPK